jgi:hypothetical protein
MTFATMPAIPAPLDTSDCPPGVTTLPYLSALTHPTTGVVMHFDPYLYESTSALERESVAYVVPGSDSAIDPMGVGGNPVSIRTLTVQFLRPYQQGENWTSVMYDWHRMIAHGQKMQAERTMPDGTKQYGWLKFISTPEEYSLDDKVVATYAATFQLNPPYWQEAVPPEVRVYGKGGLIYGLGAEIYGSQPRPLPAATNTFQLDARGATWRDDAAIITINGPFGGDSGITVQNLTAFNGSVQNAANQVRFTLSHNLPTANDQYVVKCGANSVKRNGLGAWGDLSRPSNQLIIFRIEPGFVNQVQIIAAGANPRVGGNAMVRWARKFV